MITIFIQRKIFTKFVSACRPVALLCLLLLGRSVVLPSYSTSVPTASAQLSVHPSVAQTPRRHSQALPQQARRAVHTLPKVAYHATGVPLLQTLELTLQSYHTNASESPARYLTQ